MVSIVYLCTFHCLSIFAFYTPYNCGENLPIPQTFNILQLTTCNVYFVRQIEQKLTPLSQSVTHMWWQMCRHSFILLYLRRTVSQKEYCSSSSTICEVNYRRPTTAFCVKKNKAQFLGKCGITNTMQFTLIAAI